MWESTPTRMPTACSASSTPPRAIRASGDYAAAVAAVAFCGFVAALIAYAFAPEKLQGWKWLGTVVLVFGADRAEGDRGHRRQDRRLAVKVVDNVPFGVAVLGSLTSTIGHADRAFRDGVPGHPGRGAPAAELSYQQNGLMFGNRLIRETGNVVFQDPAFRTDLINFIHNCTDLRPDRRHPRSGHLFHVGRCLAVDGLAQSARFSTLTAAGGAVGVDTCPNVYQSLNGRLPAQITRIQGRLAFQLNPTLPGAAAAASSPGRSSRPISRTASPPPRPPLPT